MKQRQYIAKTKVYSIYKEHLGYGKEAETQQKRIDKLIASEADEYDVRKQASSIFTY